MDVDPILGVRLPETLTQEKQETWRPQDWGTVWEAMEAFTSPELAQRRTAFEQLRALGVARLSPLAAYHLSTRLTEPDIELRARIVQALAETLSPDETGRLAPEAVRSTLAAQLSAMRTRSTFALLQVVDFDKSAEPLVARLLSCCSFAGGHLADILSNRQISLAVRKQAAFYIGRIGYLDALPSLERMAARLENRINAGGLIREDDETGLLPLIRDALSVLRAP
jgi:hypothetical protein